MAGTCRITVWQGEHVLFSKGLPTAGQRKFSRVLSQNRQLVLCAWSSSEYDNNNAWIVNANNGDVNNNNKNNNNFYVRCVLAFWNKVINRINEYADGTF